MTCPFCGHTRIFGKGELATCAACGRFVVSEDPFMRLRAEMSAEEWRAERRIREGTHRNDVLQTKGEREP